MAPRLRGSAKKRASSSREGLSDVFSSQKIKPECRFVIDKSKMTEWTVNLLTSLGLLSILTPRADVYYPRLVAMFYQNLVQLNDDPLALSTTIDGVDILITEATMAYSMGCPESMPIDSHLSAPGKVDMEDIYKSLQVRGRRVEHKIDHVNLPQELWFLSYVLYKNVVVLGHKTERRRPILDLLYYAYTATWFSPISYMIDNMLQISMTCNTRSKIGAKQVLLYPFLITKLLMDQGFVFDEDEPSSKVSGSWDFKKSYNTSVRNLKKTIALAHSQGTSSSAPPEDDLQYEVSSEESDDQPTREEFNAMSDEIREIGSTTRNTN